MINPTVFWFNGRYLVSFFFMRLLPQLKVMKSDHKPKGFLNGRNLVSIIVVTSVYRMKPKYVLQDFKIELNLGIYSSCFFRALGDEVKCIYLKLF